MKSESFMLSKRMLTFLENHGIKDATPVQKKIIPAIMSGRDVVVQSETGSGKTLSFAIPIIESILTPKYINALILVPTRELCTQISEEFNKFSHKGIGVCPVYGGVSIDNQIRKLKNTSIVVATPGRLLDIINRKAIKLDEIKFAVLDEADRMLDMGFISDIEKIMKHLPAKRQTLLFSATISNEIAKLSRKFLNDPVSLALEANVKPEFLRQTYYRIHTKKKMDLLIKLLKEERELVVVFCNRKRITETVAKELSKNGISAKCLNGNMTQANREKVTAQFREGKFTVLIATDVAARGLHIDGITHVYNYEIPKEPESYTHRIGRTARAGKKGEAISFVSGSDDEKFFRQILFEHKGIITLKQEPGGLESAQPKKNSSITKHKKDMESSKPEKTDKKAKKSGKTVKVKKQAESQESISDELSALLQPETAGTHSHGTAESDTGQPEDVLGSLNFGDTFSGKERKGGKLKTGRKKVIETAAGEKQETPDTVDDQKEFLKHGKESDGDKKGPVSKFGKKKFGKPGEKKWSKPGEKKWNKPGEKKWSKPADQKWSKPGEKKWSKPGEKKWSKPGEKKWSKPGEKKWSDDKPWRNDMPLSDRPRSGKPGFSKNKFGDKKKFGQQGAKENAKKFDVYKASDDGKSFNKEIYNREEDLYAYARSQERGKKGFDKSQLFKHIEPNAYSGINKSHTPKKNFKKKFNPQNKKRRNFY